MKTHLTEEFKKAYDINDLNQCQFLLLRLILEYNAEINEGKIYDHNLKHLLFNTNCVRNPMGFKYSDEDYKKHSQIFTNIIELCNRINNPDIDTTNLFRINLVVDNRIIDDLIDIVIYTYCFYNMNSVNSRRMDDSEVSKLPFAEHLLNIILFYEDQTRILRQNYHKTFSKDMITGLEMSIRRRKESIKHDWKKFKEKASLTLPEDPFDEEHIILVACTDTFDFTPLKYDDVYITDDSTYLKYFTNPHVEIIESDIEKITIKQHMNLWSKGYPTAEEFVNYLIDPVTIHPFADYIEKQFIPIPVMDKDDLIMVCEELMLTDDPIKAEITKYNK